MLKEHKLFLEKLRRSGKTNMFGADPWLQKQFGMSKKEAYAVLSEWINSYDPKDPDYEELGK